MLTAAADLLAGVAFPIAVERGPGLQKRLRGLAGADNNEPLLIRPSASPAWLMLDADRNLQVIRDPPLGVRRLLIDEIIDRDGDLRRELMAAAWHPSVYAEARGLTTPIFEVEQLPSREQLERLLSWAPLVEHAAYRYFTHASTLVDELRRSVLAAIDKPGPNRDSMLLAYWKCLHTMGHLLTIASTPGARPWLSEMAASFAWVTWTPTFILLRERTLWLAAAAAKSAVAFGASIVDKYLAKLLSANHPMESFDALTGLVAIGLDQWRLSADLISDLKAIGASAIRNRRPNPDHLRMMLDTAIATLREPDIVERRFAGVDRYERGHTPPTGSEPLGLDPLRRDPTEYLPSGDVLGIIALPTIVRSSPTNYYPRHQPSTGGLVIPPREIRRILKRAWTPRSSLLKPQTIH